MDGIRILIILGDNQYGVIERFAKGLKAGFEREGCVADWLDIRPLSGNDNVEAVLAVYKNRKYDFIVVFNHWMISLRELFIKSEKTIIWSFLVDPPAYHLERMQLSSENVIVSFIDRNHLAYAQRELRHLSYITFMPHGGSRAENLCPYADRKRTVVFLGSYTDTEELEKQLTNEKEPWRHLLERAVCRLYGGETDFQEILEEELDFKGRKFTEYQRKLCILKFRYIYSLVRNIKRIHLLEILGAAGISVEVYGNGWEAYENKYPQFIHICGSVDYDRTLEIMAETKLVLNNMPLYTDGSHERVFSAMRCGAVCLTEENIYLRQEFEENREIIFFNYRNLEQLPEKIRFLSEHETLAEHIAETGRKKAEKFHTWENRAESMLEILLSLKESQQDWGSRHVPVHSESDEAFNRLLFQISGLDEDMLYEKMKAKFIRQALFDSTTLDLLERSFSSYPYWGRLKSREGVFEICRQRAHQLKAREEEFIWLYQRMGDETSKMVLAIWLRNWLFDTSVREMPQEHWRQYFDLDIIHFEEQEVFVDCGAYTGDSFVDFVLQCKDYRKIYCYEFNEKNLEKLRETAKEYENVMIRPCAVGDENREAFILEPEDASATHLAMGEVGIGVSMVALDSDIKEKITFIKADIEGAEKLMLLGAKRHIQKEKPKLAIAVYHGNYDILDIPLTVEEINPTYKFYLRYYGGSFYPNEIILYAL